MSIIISGSGVRTGNSTTKVLEFGTEGTLTLNGDLATTGSAGFTAITATGLASLDGGINVADTLTVSNAGAVAGATTLAMGGALTGVTTLAASSNATVQGIVSGAAGTFDALGGTSLALQSGGITAAGPIAGVSTLAMGGALTGVTTLAASSTATVQGIVSGAAGTFDALGGTSLALQSGGITAAGAVAGVTTLGASGVITGGTLTDGAFSVNSGAVTGVTTLAASSTATVQGIVSGAAGTFDALGGTSLALQSGGITAAGPIAGVSTLNASSAVTAGSFTDGTATLAAGNLSGVGHLTASYAKIDVLDVNQINSITSTVSDLEVSDRRIISALSASSAAADGGGLRIGGGASTAGHASVLFDHGNSRLNINYGGNRVAHADASGFDVVGALDVTGLVTAGSFNDGTATYDAGVISNGASATFSGLVTAGSLNDGTATYDAGVISNGASATFSGVVTAGGLTVGTAVLNEADLEKLDDLTGGTVTVSKAVVVNATKDITSFNSLTGVALTGSVSVSGPLLKGTTTVSGAAGTFNTFGAGAGGSGLSINAAGGIFIAGTQMTATAAELNYLDNNDLTAADITKLAALTATAAELNYLDNDDLTAADITKLAALTATAAQLNHNSGVTAGTAAASKTMVLDGNADITGGRNLTITGELDAATLDISGRVNIDGDADFGVNGTGVDVKMFGGTAGSYMLWDEDQNTLKLNAAPLSGTTVCVMGAAPSSGVAIATPETWAVKAGQFITYSDGTLKKNVKQLDGAIEKVMSMRGVSYEMKKGAEGRTEVGFIAQEMKQLVPEVVYGDADGNYGIDYGKITSVLVEAVKAQQSQIEELKALLKK